MYKSDKKKTKKHFNKNCGNRLHNNVSQEKDFTVVRNSWWMCITMSKKTALVLSWRTFTEIILLCERLQLKSGRITGPQHAECWEVRWYLLVVGLPAVLHRTYSATQHSTEYCPQYSKCWETLYRYNVSQDREVHQCAEEWYSQIRLQNSPAHYTLWCTSGTAVSEQWRGWGVTIRGSQPFLHVPDERKSRGKQTREIGEKIEGQIIRVKKIERQSKGIWKLVCIILKSYEWKCSFISIERGSFQQDYCGDDKWNDPHQHVVLACRRLHDWSQGAIPWNDQTVTALIGCIALQCSIGFHLAYIVL